MTVPYRRVGRIQKSHGTQGEVVVAVGDGLFLEDLIGIDVWIVPPLAAVKPYRVIDVRRGPKGAIVALDGVVAVATAHELVGRWILAATASLPEPASAPTDVLEYVVADAKRGYLGVVTDVIVTGANDVFVVDEGPYGQVLLPVIDQVIREIDDVARSITVELLDGLIDEESDS